MAHIIINPTLSATIGYNLFLNQPKYVEVSAILEPAHSTGTDYSSNESTEEQTLGVIRIQL